MRLSGNICNIKSSSPLFADVYILHNVWMGPNFIFFVKHPEPVPIQPD